MDKSQSENEANKPIAILLTATITPHPGIEGVQRFDPDQRLTDYITALKFYLSLPDDLVNRVIFVENSGYNLSEIEESITISSNKKKLELISVPTPNVSKPSKENGEFRLMDDGIQSSSLLMDDDIFLKITGRLRFINLESFLKNQLNTYDLMCDLHNIPFIGHGMKASKYMDLRVFFCRVSTYKSLFFGLAAGDELAITATRLYSLITSNMDNYQIIPRFPREALLSGIGARHNRDYSSGIPKLKRILRSLLRQVFPSVWL